MSLLTWKLISQRSLTVTMWSKNPRHLVQAGSDHDFHSLFII